MDIDGKNIEIIKTKRKTMSLEIKPDMRIILRAPFYAANSDIISFVNKHINWINKTYEKMENMSVQRNQYSELKNKDIRELTLKARKIIPTKVAFYAEKIGVTYGKITIRHQKTRWGSCSREGNLSFNCLLMLAPEDVIDSVVIHELCHRKYMNHSKEFYEEIYKVCPEYKTYQKWLKDNAYLC